MEFPLGAPILMGGETEIKEGKAVYRFGRCEHRECRVFVKQKSGIISAHETTSYSIKYRRRIKVCGFEDAEVYFFPETYCEKDIRVLHALPNAEWHPEFDESFKPFYSEEFGWGFKAEQVTGDRFFMMPQRKFVKEE
jgi:hypothetical protein